MNFQEDLKAYLDGELSPERTEEVRLALLQDEGLRQDYEFMKLLSNEIKDAAREPSVVARPENVPLSPAKAIGLSLAGKWSLGVSAGLAAALAIGFVTQLPLSSNSSSAPTVSNPSVPTLNPSVPESAAPSDTVASPPFEARANGGAVATAGDNFRAAGDAAKAAPNFKVSPREVNAAPSGEVAKSAYLDVQVRDVQSTVEGVAHRVESLGGFVKSREVNNQNDLISATLHVRIPRDNFETFLAWIRALGVVTGESTTAEDVTESEVDNTKRMATLKAEESGYVSMLKTSHRVSDTMDIKDRLNEVRTEIARLDADQSKIKGQVKMSEIALTFHQNDRVRVSGNWFGEATTDAFNALVLISTTLGRGLIFLAALFPVWGPIAAVWYWISRRKAR